jgi:hypothetical protein
MAGITHKLDDLDGSPCNEERAVASHGRFNACQVAARASAQR